MNRFFLTAVFCLVALGANAQSVRQSGNVTPGTLRRWATTGVIVDGGAAGGNVVTGTIVANDFVCTTAGGVPFDCGGGFGTNNIWTGTAGFNGAATFNSTVDFNGTVNFHSSIIQALTQYHFFIGNASNVSTDTALTGDCTYGASGIICTKTNNVAFVASATTDTTNAANISSGTLLAARMPALTGDVTTSVSTVATTIARQCGVELQISPDGGQHRQGQRHRSDRQRV